jgi:hypothetical protein
MKYLKVFAAGFMFPIMLVLAVIAILSAQMVRVFSGLAISSYRAVAWWDRWLR